MSILDDDRAKLEEQARFSKDKQERDRLRISRELEQERILANGKLPSSPADLSRPDTAEAIDSALRLEKEIRKNKLPFINQVLSRFLGIVGGSVTLIAGQVGDGKSTCSANIALAIMKNGGKVAVFSNEELDIDIRRRIACIYRNVSLYDLQRGNLSQDKIDLIDETIKETRVALKIVDKTYKNSPLHVTSVDGMTNLMEGAVRDYDAVIIDQYTNIATDTRFPSRPDYVCQGEFGRVLNSYVGSVRAAIFVMSQLKTGAQDRGHFQDRLRGSKSAWESCTAGVELVGNSSEYSVEFICWKDRHFGRAKGAAVKLGFDREVRTYVANPDKDEAFQAKVQKWKGADETSGYENKLAKLAAKPKKEKVPGTVPVATTPPVPAMTPSVPK